ncbi:MAG TPA: histidine phosphatase family protein [Mycobacteriales bacterium]|nr:histidine phosphatase family protein [Mycobacteriales bacterium]
MLASHTSLSCAAAVAHGRAHSTAAIIGGRINRTTTVFEELAEVDHGAFAGLTNEEIEVSHPGVLARRASRKYTWRFPGGESYRDTFARRTARCARSSRSSCRSSSAIAPKLMQPCRRFLLLGATLPMGCESDNLIR